MISTTRSLAGPREAERGFTLIEVMVTLVIVSSAVVGLSADLGQSVDLALVTKVNRQMRHLARFQMGQITVGQLHPDEEDPFPDGQTGTFDDVGGYAEEYVSFNWELAREELAICGSSEEELQDAGFVQDESGTFIRPQTDDILSGQTDDLEEPQGQFKTRVMLTIRWHAEAEDGDRSFSIVTYLPVKDEESQDTSGAPPGGEPGAGTPGAPGAPGAPGTPGAVTGISKDPR